MSGEFRLGSWAVHPSLNRIERNGKTTHLEPKVVEVLVYLADHSGGVVSKEQLIQAVWGSAFVTDDVLTRCVSELRKALEDDAKEPRVIETIPKRGYRLLLEVEWLNGAGQTSVIDPPRPHPRRKVLLIAMGIVILATVASYFLFARSPRPAPRVLRTTPITQSRAIQAMAGSPHTDGSRIFFSRQTGDKVGVAQVSVWGGEPTPVSTPFKESTWLSNVSPDGSEFLLTTSLLWRDSPLWIMQATGGTVWRLGDANGHDGAWSADGQKIVYGRGHDLYTVNKDGSGAHKIVTVGGTPRWPRWSPDGSRVRFTILEEDAGVGALNDARSLWEISDGGRNLHPLLPGFNDPPMQGPGDWTRDGKDFVFEATHNGLTSIWVIAEKSGLFRKQSPPVQLTAGPIDMFDPLPSKDGNRIFAIGEQIAGELVRYDMKAGTFESYLAGISAEGVTFSRDRQWIAYVTFPDGILWRCKADGSERLQLTQAPMLVNAPRWSPDGGRIAFMARIPGSQLKIYAISAAGGSPESLVSNASDQIFPGWSADGRSLIFGVAESSASKSSLYLLDLESRILSQLPGSEGMNHANWSPDGRYIAAIRDTESKLQLMDFRTHRWSLLDDEPDDFAWSHDGRYLYEERGDAGVFRIHISDRKAEKVADAKGIHRADGRFGTWLGLTPEDSPLLLRDLSIQQIYALDWENH